MWQETSLDEVIPELSNKSHDHHMTHTISHMTVT